MAKGYWISFYHSITNRDALAEYAAAAGPAIRANGGRFLARGAPTGAYEAAIQERTVIIEFDSVDRAISAYESSEYQAARKLLDGVAVRDVRIIEGIE